jgi:hypothetical protein
LGTSRDTAFLPSVSVAATRRIQRRETMNTTTDALGLLPPVRSRIHGTIAAVAAVGTCLIVGAVAVPDARAATSTAPHARAATASAPPTAAGFAELLLTLSNAYAQQHGEKPRLQNADCVQGASRDHYMCSYTVVRPGRSKECHLMQAEWTPNGPASFQVTVAGRVARCANLREALGSLK